MWARRGARRGRKPPARRATRWAAASGPFDPPAGPPNPNLHAVWGYPPPPQHRAGSYTEPAPKNRKDKGADVAHSGNQSESPKESTASADLEHQMSRDRGGISQNEHNIQRKAAHALLSR